VPAVSLADLIRARVQRALVPAAVSLVPLIVDGRVAGRITPGRVHRLAEFTTVFERRGQALALAPGTPQARSAALADVAAALASEGALSAWRDERYAVAPTLDAPPWFELERAAARYFGIRTYAAHVNGLVREPDRVTMWIARRSATKAIDPGMLDNLVGGGVAAGTSVAATVVKECAEEAGIGATLAGRARLMDTLHIVRLHPDGLQDEVVFAHDLWLPPDFAPANKDGEVTDHHRFTLKEVGERLANDEGAGAMTLDAALVALTALLREGTFADDRPGHAALDALLRDLAGLRVASG